jgi:flagellar basal body-associated protein FliL
MDIVSIVVALLAFNAGFLFGAFWVSAKNNDAKDAEASTRPAWRAAELR